MAEPSNIDGISVCPTCRKPVAGSEAFAARYEGPLCSPIGSPDCWRLVGRSTKGGPLTPKRLLRVFDGGGDRG